MHARTGPSAGPIQAKTAENARTGPDLGPVRASIHEIGNLLVCKHLKQTALQSTWSPTSLEPTESTRAASQNSLFRPPDNKKETTSMIVSCAVGERITRIYKSLIIRYLLDSKMKSGFIFN